MDQNINETILKDLRKSFRILYGPEPTAAYFCPGRINLIGEHIDYNGGIVMPCAISFGTWLLVSPNQNGSMVFNSLNFTEQFELPLNNTVKKQDNNWYNYPAGVINLLRNENIDINRGLNLLFYGNLPIGAGLSSSASIEILTAFAVNDIFDGNKDKLSLVTLCKQVENDFIGVNSGIMDQFTVAFGEEGRALMLNCEDLNYKPIDLNLGKFVLAIINTNKKRTLAESKYNQRVQECQQALKLLQTQLSIDNLCQINTETLFNHKSLITDALLFKRARHVVEENDRVKQAAVAINDADIRLLGNLMNQSHCSLKNLYEVSGDELDTIAEYSRYYKGVLGSRMTGAGFGGCAISLVLEETFADYCEDMSNYYYNKFGYLPSVYKSEIGSGVMQLDLTREYLCR